MSEATSISLSKFTASVQAAVKAAVAKHPKFKLDPPHEISVAYLIRGIPVPDALLAHASVTELQSFANDVAGHISGAHPGVFAAPGGAGAQGAVLSIGKHVIIGIPPAVQTFTLEK